MDKDHFIFLKQVLSSIGTLDVEVTGYSMWPVLKDGEMVEIEKIAPQDIRRFDILVFHDSEGLVCHYVWKIEKEQLMCRSLCFNELDVVSDDSVLGRLKNKKLSWGRKLWCRWI